MHSHCSCRLLAANYLVHSRQNGTLTEQEGTRRILTSFGCAV